MTKIGKKVDCDNLTKFWQAFKENSYIEHSGV